jgi:hypothetical protein
MPTSKAIFFVNFLLEKKYGVPSHNFVKKNTLCEKGYEITRFDGTFQSIMIFRLNTIYANIMFKAHMVSVSAIFLTGPCPTEEIQIFGFLMAE